MRPPCGGTPTVAAGATSRPPGCPPPPPSRTDPGVCDDGLASRTGARVAPMTALERNNVTVHGRPDGPPMVFAHGFGCDQNMWRFVWPAFADDHRDRAVRPRRAPAAPTSPPTTPSATRSLRRLRRRRARDLPTSSTCSDVVFVGHSVSAMIGVLAAAAEPERFGAPRPGRPVAALHRRRRLRRRLHARGHRRAARLAGQQLPRLVERDGAGDHGQRRPARARRGADRTASAAPTRRSPRHFARVDVPVRQPRRPRAGAARRALVLQCSDDVIAPDGRRRVRARASSPAAGSSSSRRPATARTSARPRRPSRRSRRSSPA